MIRRWWYLCLAYMVFPACAFAAAVVMEGEKAEKLYATEKDKAQILVQANKVFILRVKGEETPKPQTITVKVGERFYIANEEHTFVHNVYDESDSTWVLKKQEPSKVAALTFDKPGTHKLRCAIHPTMKTELRVVP